MGKKRKTKGQKIMGLRRTIKNNNLLVLNEGVDLKKLTLEEIDELRQAIANRAKNDKITRLKKGHGKRPPRSKRKKQPKSEIVDLGSASFVCSSCDREYEMEWSTVFDIQECTHGYVGFDTNQDYISCPYCGGQQKKDDFDFMIDHDYDIQKSACTNHRETDSKILIDPFDPNDPDDIPF